MATLPPVITTTTTTSSTPAQTTTTPGTTTTTSTTPTTSTTSTRPTSATTSTTSTSTTPTSTTTTSAPPTTTPTSATSVLVSTGKGGDVQTITQVVAITPSRNVDQPTQDSSSGSSKPFFQNKAAVAGVFSVVGIVGLALIFLLVTNAIRRRRAEKFDRDVAEAAREAAKASAPMFEDDDPYGQSPSSGLGRGGGYGQYSDAGSHGTFNQPPMSHHGLVESYGMSEMGRYDSYPGGAAATGYAAGAGAAGIGATAVSRAKSQREARTRSQQGHGGEGGYGAQGNPGYAAPLYEEQAGYEGYEGGGYGNEPLTTPYAKFAAPSSPPPHDSYNHRYPGGGQDGYLNAGPGPGQIFNAGTPVAMGNADLTASTAQNPPDLNRSLSKATSGALSSNTATLSNESYAAHYQPGFRQSQAQPGLSHVHPESSGGGDAYGGYEDTTAIGLAMSGGGSFGGSVGSPAKGNSSPRNSRGSAGAADSPSEYDDEEYEEPQKRVLKVANE